MTSERSRLRLADPDDDMRAASRDMSPAELARSARARNVERAYRQGDDAMDALDLPESAFVRWPWPELDHLVGGMGPKTVHIPCAFSGAGKTTLVSSAVNGWADMGVKVAVLPLETEPNTFRTYLACHRLSAQGVQVSPGEVLTGFAMRRHNWPELRASLKNEIRRSVAQEHDRLWVAEGVERLGADDLLATVDEAASWGAQVLVVDHVDHLKSGKDADGYGAAREVNDRLLDLAKEYDLRVVATSQLNLSALAKGDKLAKYEPPSLDHLLFKSAKIHNAFTILGLFRPHRRPMIRQDGSGESADEYAAALAMARKGTDEPFHALEPDTMGVVVMKSRAAGARVVTEAGVELGRIREGGRTYLRVTHGRVEPLPAADRLDYEQSLHAVASQMAARAPRRGGRTL